MTSLPAPPDRRRARLEARIRRRHATLTERLQIGPLSLEFTRVADPDQVLVQMVEQAQATGRHDPRWEPYWAEAWDSAFAIGWVLAHEELKDLRVLDLGCGLGLPGVVAAARGAQVVMVDAAQPALLFARLNAWPWRERVQVRRVDWRCDRLAGNPFALIVGADILYQYEEWPFLERFWRAHLAPQGRVLLGEPGRGISAGFRQWLSARGWHLACHELGEPVCRRRILLIEARREPPI
jgi:predicted nicotinamide N-methyase